MAEDIEPSKDLEHPNEYVSEEDLVEAKLFEFNQEEMERQAQEEREQQGVEEVDQARDKGEWVGGTIGEEVWEQEQEPKEDPVMMKAEEGLQGQLQDGVENALDVLDDENMFDVTSDTS